MQFDWNDNSILIEIKLRIYLPTTKQDKLTTGFFNSRSFDKDCFRKLNVSAWPSFPPSKLFNCKWPVIVFCCHHQRSRIAIQSEAIALSQEFRISQRVPFWELQTLSSSNQQTWFLPCLLFSSASVVVLIYYKSWITVQ